MIKYSDGIMSDLRENLNLEPEDESKDGLIENMTRREVLNRVATWNGLVDYGSTIRYWIEEIYGIKLSND